MLANRKLDSSIETINQSVVAIHLHLTGKTIEPLAAATRANLARNALKHWSAGQPPVVEFDPVEEARDMLNRAIDNYWALSPAMERFQREYIAA